MKIRKVTTNHLVKGEDLNHHGTLFAGRAAEWFVESGFLAAAAWVPAENIVLVKINSMTFSRSSASTVMLILSLGMPLIAVLISYLL